MNKLFETVFKNIFGYSEMNINLRVSGSLADLKFETTDTIVHEYYSTIGNKPPQETIEQLITVANELYRFNGGSDLEFVNLIADSFLNVPERNELALLL